MAPVAVFYEQAPCRLCRMVQQEIQLGMTTVEIAAKLAIYQSAVSRLSMRAEEIAREIGTELI
jgi:hypothetical protein